ncbi:MAG: phenyltransferase domain-containing protein [Pseudomonadota bacterium]
MALSTAGYLEEARRAYAWSASIQMEDGSFYASYRDGRPEERRKDPNMASYLAVGVFHHFLITRDIGFLESMWPAVSAAVDFCVGLQGPCGEIWWAMDDDGRVDQRALLTGSSSIHLSIRCALATAARLGHSRPRWEFARRKLAEAIRNRDDCFDMSKSRYSMDWYYPILCGAVTGNDAHRRIDEMWDLFVVENWGVRCVSDRPWVTMAESSELVLALAGIGRLADAERVFSWVRNSRYDDGLYWTGLTFPDSVIWPEERTSWTTAAVLLAADVLYNYTPGGLVFCQDYWKRDIAPPRHVPAREKISAA